MVLDGTPLENEMLILANRFELTGTVKIQPGVDITVDMTPDDVNGGTNIVTNPPNLGPGTIRIGDLEFPKYDFKLPCDNNSMVIFPGWVEHGVRKVKIKDTDYYDGWGRYAITSFFGSKSKYLTS